MTTQRASGKCGKVHPDVLVKGYGNEPFGLRLRSVSRQIVVGQSLTSDTTIDLRREWVFQWDDGLFYQIREAHQAGDRPLMASLWNQAEPLDS